MKYSLWLLYIAFVAPGCDNPNDIGTRRSEQNQGGTQSGSGAAAGVGGTGSGATGGTSAGGTSTGGTSAGGTSTGGSAGAPGGSGGSSGAECMTSSDCVQPGGICSEAHCIEGSCRIVQVCTIDAGSDAAVDASGSCGAAPCSPTRCDRIDCGPAVCCSGDTGPVCLHGTAQCPPSFARKTLQCWAGGPTGSAALLASCVTAADCFVARHYTGCCHVDMVGVHVSEASRFEAFEATCGGAPPCGCCCDIGFSEDGRSNPVSTAVTVDCVAGMCKTSGP